MGCEKLVIAEVEKVDDDVEYVEYTITRSCVNLIDPQQVKPNSFITTYGKVERDVEKMSVVTPFLPLSIGELWYQKVKYLHACCLRDSKYGFDADIVAFYDADKLYITQIHDIDGPLIIPERAEYARIQFRSTDKQLFSSITNRSILSDFSEYDRTKLIPSQDLHLPGFANSDGSITQLLRVGYDYLDRGFGYGSLHTAFNSDCIKTQAYNGYYLGEKWQIDCSSFVELALTGVSYNNSRYVRGNEFENISLDNSFAFDQNAEYNYNMIQFPEECGADKGRMYANKIAKYFYDRGFLYEVSEGFENVKIGDLLFWGSITSEDVFFKGISHVAICSDKWKKKDGRYGIRVLETASENVRYYNNDICYGARPALPYVDYYSLELVKSITEESFSFSLRAGETKVVSELILSEDLYEREVYTLYIKCDIPDNVSLICKNSFERDSIGSEDLEEVYFPEGIIKHFGVRNKILGEEKNVIQLCLYSPVEISGTISIDEASLRRGYHSDTPFQAQQELSSSQNTQHQCI